MFRLPLYRWPGGQAVGRCKVCAFVKESPRSARVKRPLFSCRAGRRCVLRLCAGAVLKLEGYDRLSHDGRHWQKGGGMAGISEEDVRRVREASDLVALVGERTPLRQRGRDFWCCCPFHEERTPSCKIDPSTQLWHCFGCGEGGDVFSYVMKLEDLSFPEAVRWLAERAGIQIADAGPALPRGRKARLKEVCKKTAEFYHLQLMRSKSTEAAQARAYLGGRGLGGSVPADWDLGFAPGRGTLVRHLRQLGFTNEEMAEANVALSSDGRGLRDRFYNRVMFPIRDVQGECIAFGGRVVGQGEPKYLNSQETPIFHKSEVLYGLDKAKVSMASTGIAVVVEGYTDVIALSEAGVKNVVATLGTALTPRHIRALSRHAQKRIVYLFDGDAAGQRAADRALQFIDRTMTPEAGRSQIELCAVTLPDDLDPADFVRERGVEKLRSLLDDAQPLLKYGIERRLARFDLSTAEGRNRAVGEALAVLAPIKDSLLAKDYAVQIAGKVRAREEDVLEMLAALKPPALLPDQGRGAGSELSGASGASGRPAATGDQEFASSSTSTRASTGAPALPSSERNRLRFEREFLCLMARRSDLAMSHLGVLSQTAWHLPLHERAAATLLDVMAEEPGLGAAETVARAEAREPGVARILTSGALSGAQDDTTFASFLAEELSIGDLEDQLAAMQEQLKNADSLPEEVSRSLFESVMGLGEELRARRLSHAAEQRKIGHAPDEG